MNKKVAIEWLQGYTCASGDDIAEMSSLMSHDLHILLPEALAVAVECEELLKQMFEGWLEDTPPEKNEDTTNTEDTNDA